MAKFNGRTVLFTPTITMTPPENWRLIKEITVADGEVTEIDDYEFNLGGSESYVLIPNSIKSYSANDILFLSITITNASGDIGLYIKDNTTGTYTEIATTVSSGTKTKTYTCTNTGYYSLYVQKQNIQPGSTTGTLTAMTITKAVDTSYVNIITDTSGHSFALKELYATYTLPSAMSATKTVRFFANGGTAEGNYIFMTSTGTGSTNIFLAVYAEKIANGIWKTAHTDFGDGEKAWRMGYKMSLVDDLTQIKIQQTDNIPVGTVIKIYGKDA